MQREESKNKSENLWYDWMCKSDAFAFYHTAKSLAEWADTNKLLDVFLSLKIEKRYFYGDRNSEMPVLKLIENKIKTISISNSGHFMMTDNPKEFYTKLVKNSLRFVNQL